MRSDAPSYSELMQDHQTAKALGSPQLSSNAMLVLDIAPDIRLLIQSFTFPIDTLGEPADVAYAGGLASHLSGVPKTDFTSSLTILETSGGRMVDLAELLMQYGETDAWAYYGRPNAYTKRFRMIDCAITFDNGIEASADGRSQVATIQGNMRYNYFGQNESLGGGSSETGLLEKAGNIVNQLGKAKQVAKDIRNLTRR